MRAPAFLCLLLLPALFVSACGSESAGPATGSSPFLQAADPQGAVPIAEAKSLAVGTEVTIAGRMKDLTAGRAIFTLVDVSFPHCLAPDSPMPDCKTPWDWCCWDVKDVAGASLVVELPGPDGRPVRASDLGTRLLDVVSVHGRIAARDDGAPYLIASSGWHLRSRPTLPPGVHLP